MPVHDWSRVEAGVFHAFHHAWIEEISRVLNSGILPPPYYALAEQRAAGFGPDVLTLEARGNDDDDAFQDTAALTATATLVRSLPTAQVTAEADLEFYRRKQSAVVVRHASGDRMVAVVEIVSPGNKAARGALRSFVEKAAELLDHGIHLVILDVCPPGPRDPEGIHGAIWEEISGQQYSAPLGKPLTLASYESGETVRAYVEPIAIGARLPDVPLFLEPGAHVLVPAGDTYHRAFAAMPQRWKSVLE
jgi:hypothetical protein